MLSLFRRNRIRRTVARKQPRTTRPVLEALEDRRVLSAFYDGFEGPTLDPFWTKEEYSGYVTAPSTAVVHSGNQALQLNSSETSVGKQVGILHNFPSPIYGKISVWMYDTGADISSSNYMGVWMHNRAENPGQWNITMGGYDYDFGNDVYHFSLPGMPDVQQIQVDRTNGWHHFEIMAYPSSMTFRIDGAAVYSGPDDVRFDHVELVMNAPYWRPAYVTYFDDFEFVPYEPPVEITVEITGAPAISPEIQVIE